MPQNRSRMRKICATGLAAMSCVGWQVVAQIASLECRPVLRNRSAIPPLSRVSSRVRACRSHRGPRRGMRAPAHGNASITVNSAKDPYLGPILGGFAAQDPAWPRTGVKE